HLTQDAYNLLVLPLLALGGVVVAVIGAALPAWLAARQPVAGGPRAGEGAAPDGSQTTPGKRRRPGSSDARQKTRQPEVRRWRAGVAFGAGVARGATDARGVWGRPSFPLRYGILLLSTPGARWRTLVCRHGDGGCAREHFRGQDTTARSYQEEHN